MRYSSLKLFILLVFFTLAVASCRKEVVSENELIDYVADEGNGLTKSIHVGQITISVSLQPTDLLVVRELRGNVSATPEQVHRAISKYASQYYFTIRLSRNKQELATPAQVGVAGFGELLQTLSFEMGDKVKLITSGRDTLAVADYIYNRTFGAARSSDLLFAFRKEEMPINDGQLELTLDEFGLGTGKQVFSFNKEDITDVPKIFANEKTNSQ